ncbi:MAG TPA: biotin carboxylase N-terminal domain-containing protein [Ktedonobacterales bacterium]|nr:biotin carboxylase N-terminal domain-containing protein [Ktedonobacterales bacterium]
MRQNRQPSHHIPYGKAPGRDTQLFRKILIANRGEIACRVMRTCRAMGIATVAVYSDPDAGARHVREADEAVCLGGATSAETYLDIGKLLAAAARSGASAIHPGYGFLAESASFASACREAGITFIGPEPEVIARMGLKREAKLLMAQAGVPVVPGYDGNDQSDAAFLAAARDIGFPVMIKASAGGGGKGMRAVRDESDLLDALASARREAQSAFGDGTLILERVIPAPRHVEFQIFGDDYGGLVHMGERECTIQRRHQKIIEETPSTALTPALRARMAAAALTVGRTLSYTNAGTVEFILDPTGDFYFLEVNTRLQVEHPVTELVTALDLVRWQILLAEGHSLPLSQDDITFTGHAIEARVYAEDPANGFLPATGHITLWREPSGEGVRVDAGIATGTIVSPYYDPMLAKISAHGVDREEALRRLERALAHTTLFGVRNNLAFLRRVLLHPAHVAGRLSTAFLDHHAGQLLAPATPPVQGFSGIETAALVAALARQSTGSPLRYWRNNVNRPVIERFSNGESEDTALIEVRLTPTSPNRYAAILIHGAREAVAALDLREQAGIDIAIALDGHLLRATTLATGGGGWDVKVGDDSYRLTWRSPLPEPELPAGSAGSLAAPMPGQVLAVLVAQGQAVSAGDPLLILEAMKMEHTIRAPSDGLVAALHFGSGDQVPAGATLVTIQQQVATES